MSRNRQSTLVICARFVLAACALLSLTTVVKVGSAQELSPARQRVVDERLIPAYQSGNPGPLLDTARRLLNSTQPAERAAIDERLRHAQMPTLGAMLLDARISLFSRGNGFGKPRPQANEVLAILPDFKRRADKVLMEVSALPVMRNDQVKPRRLQDYESWFWALNDAQAQAGQTAEIARQSNEMMRTTRVERLKLSDAQKTLIERHKAVVKKLGDLHRRTQERDIELRLQRLHQAVAILESEKELAPRIVAAHFVDYDGQTLTTFFDQHAKPEGERKFVIDALNHPELAMRTREKVDRGKQLAGDLRATARMFYTGVHWWLRGRYGWSSDFYGLIKPSSALRSEAARRHVYMPPELPRKGQSMSSKYPDRRHYYTWLWEERTLQVTVEGNSRPIKKYPTGGSTKKSSPRPATKTYRSSGGITGIRRGGGGSFGGGRGGGAGSKIRIARGTVWGPINRPYSWGLMDAYDAAGYGKEYRKYLASREKYSKKHGSKSKRNPATVEYTRYIATYVRKQDPNLIYRIVGAVEYRNALDCFDWLARYCSEEEMRAFNELVKERDELEVEVNLSRNIVHPPSSLDQRAEDPNDKFRRRGLKWIMAVARTELGAMQIGWAADEDAFQRLATKYDRSEYLKTVFDGMRAHFWTLADDPELKGVLRGDANVTKTLAYFRRVLVAEGFLDGAAALGQEILTQTQQKEMLDWKQKLNQIQSVLAARIKSFHQKAVVPGRR